MVRRSRISFVLLLCVVLGAVPCAGYSKTDSKTVLRGEIGKLIDSFHANVGVAVCGLDFKDTLSFNGWKHYPMQSVYKFPLAVAILDGVDKGKLSLSQSIHITKESLDKNTWSPMVKDRPGQDIDIRLDELLTYMVSASDNNACDALFWLAGGTRAVNDYIHGLGITGIAIAATEAQMHKGWAAQYTNWCQPVAMAQLLQLFYGGKILSKKSTGYLMQLMTESQNSANRLKGMLPENTIVAHKTGTSNTNKKGITAATNDVGIVTLPDGKHYAIVVYVSDYRQSMEKAEALIAGISKQVWDYFVHK